MTKSERLRRRIIWHLRHVWIWYEGNRWESFFALASELGETVPVIKREVHRLQRSGALNYSFMVDYDCRVYGSGYFLAGPWTTHCPGRAEDPLPDEFEISPSEAAVALSILLRRSEP